MQRTRVKICCIATLAEAVTAISAGADALGLVGEMPSGPGTIDDDTARKIASQVPPPVATFLLTSRTRGSDIVDHVQDIGTSTVQVVSHIDPGEYAVIKAGLPGIRLVQVIHVEDATAVDLVEVYEPFVHALLLDSGCPGAVDVELGGTGRAHDWTISRRIVERSSKPVFLAGGLNHSNVREAINTVRPFGVDLCSGLRTDGRLDSQKLDAFMQEVL